MHHIIEFIKSLNTTVLCDTFKTLRPGDGNMHERIGLSMLPVMACHLVGISHHLYQNKLIVSWTLRNRIQLNFHLSRPQLVICLSIM